MNTLLVDDEPLARRELRRLLAEHPWVTVAGEAGSVAEALERAQASPPELIFLDVQMPGGSGFELLERLPRVPPVIFTTAHDRHAVRAFEVDALDYLLKPIEPARLATALARVRPQASEAPEQLFVRDGARAWLIPLTEVRLIAAEGNHVRLHWGERQPLYPRSLVAVEAQLDARRWPRANRSQLVNLDFVAGVELGVGGRLHVQLRGGPEVEVSRRQARVWRERWRL